MGFIGSLFGTDAVDAANRRTRKRLAEAKRALAAEREFQTGLFGQQQGYLTSGLGRARGQMAGATSAAAADLRDQQKQALAKMLAGGNVVNPMGFAQAWGRQTARGLGGLYGQAAQQRAGLEMQGTQMGLGVYGQYGSTMANLTGQKVDLLGSVQEQIAPSPFSAIMGGLGMAAGMGAFGGGG